MNTDTEGTWRLDLDDQRCTVLLPESSRDIVSRYCWHFDHVNGNIESALGVRLRDLVVNAPAGSEVTIDYKASHPRSQRLGVWDWRTVRLVRRSGPGFCLSRYRYVYLEPSGAWGLWLPIGGALRYFGAFGGENEAAIAANWLGPKWCPAVFRVERVERCRARRGDLTPRRPGAGHAPAAPANGGVPGTTSRDRETVCRIEWADGRVEIIDPADLA